MNKKVKITIAVICVVLLVAALATVYVMFGEKTVQGEKDITITVIDSKKNSTLYELSTDALYLRQAMEEAKGLEFSGDESEYGMMVTTVNGEFAEYNANGAYWGFNVNGSYCNNGIDTQPVNDGDAFEIVYTPAE